MKKQENNFGLPDVDYTPVGNVRMSVQFYRKLLFAPQRNKFARISVIVFGLMIFSLGIFILVTGAGTVASVGGLGDEIFIGLGSAFFGFLFTLIGGKAIYLNVFKYYRSGK